jgi:hypothetical protein
MRKAGGYAQIVSPVPTKVYLDGMRCEEMGEGIFEADTFTCCHCNRVMHVRVGERTNEEYFCRNCMARICPPCADHPCIPLMKRIEVQEERDRRLRSYGIG